MKLQERVNVWEGVPSPSGRGGREAPREGRGCRQILNPHPALSQRERVNLPRFGRAFYLALCAIVSLAVCSAFAQTPEPPSLQFARPQGAAAPPPVITLQDALERARKVDAAYQLA